jgi:hypothetical protein
MPPGIGYDDKDEKHKQMTDPMMPMLDEMDDDGMPMLPDFE